GDGGHGGSVILQVDPGLNTLIHFSRQRFYKAGRGANGGRSDRTGKSAEHLIIPVPPGTLVRDAGRGALLGDLTAPGQQLTVARGGRGGRGNARFASASHQVPRMAERGEPGDERALKLELKLIADVGIVGVPNAGKSTLLAAVSNARPKIANYPFTTLEPNLGVALVGEYRTLVLADIPGLVEGASHGVGLGFAFLRHIQRTRVLIHLLDGAGPDPLADFGQINAELALFDETLLERPTVVALNKLDLPQAQQRWPALQDELERQGYEVMAISAVAGTNVRQLLYRAAELLAEAPPLPAGEEALPVYRLDVDPEAFAISRGDDGSFHVTGKRIERAARMTYWEHDESILRFARILEASGIKAALEQAGAGKGDTVFIGEYELEWAE
ncbi:MAG: GTPase ObgE, partial [Chloroflexi bacterium]|nr:GTPase ObgE [Chloroflexota bacterium]